MVNLYSFSTSYCGILNAFSPTLGPQLYNLSLFLDTTYLTFQLYVHKMGSGSKINIATLSIAVYAGVTQLHVTELYQFS